MNGFSGLNPYWFDDNKSFFLSEAQKVVIN